MRYAVPGGPLEVERGSVTVEAAIGLGSVISALALAFAGIAAVTGQVRCTDAAQEAARLIARGDRVLAEEAVHRLAPPGASLETTGGGDTVVVRVSADPPTELLPGLRLSAESFAVLEPGVAGVGDVPG